MLISLNSDMMKDTTITVRHVKKDTYNRFRKEVITRTGKLHGSVGTELTEALELYIQGGHFSSDQKIKKTEINITITRLQRIKEQFDTSGVWDAMRIEDNWMPIKLFWKYSKGIIGTTEATKERYFKLFCDEYNITIKGIKERKGKNSKDTRTMIRYTEDIEEE